MRNSTYDLKCVHRFPTLQKGSEICMGYCEIWGFSCSSKDYNNCLYRYDNTSRLRQRLTHHLEICEIALTLDDENKKRIQKIKRIIKRLKRDLKQ